MCLNVLPLSFSLGSVFLFGVGVSFRDKKPLG